MSDNAKMVFAENLKAYLNSKGYTQLDLATYMNCSSSTVSTGATEKSILVLTKCSGWRIGLVFRCLTLPANMTNLMTPT